MLLGILSDSHDQLDRTRRAVELLQQAGVEALIHCGDLVSPEIVQACAVLPFYFVFGNGDSRTTTELELAAQSLHATCLGLGGVVELGGKRVGVVHSHLDGEVRRVLAAAPDYLLTGHSHIAHDLREGPLRRINPGALHRASTFTVALLELSTDKLEFIEVPR